MSKEVKVLGLGCANCERLYKNVKELIFEKGLDVSLEYITDIDKIMNYDVLRMPAIVIDEKVVSEGKILTKDEIEKIMYMIKK